MRHRYPIPGNDDEFEEFCLRFFRHVERCGGLVKYGKRGESQDGIDLIDQRCSTPYIAVQCKLREPHKSLRDKEILTEVALVEGSIHPIDRYIIATSARKSAKTQNLAMDLNRYKTPPRRFKVEVLFWEDICGRLDALPRAIADGIVYGNPSDETSTLLLEATLEFTRASVANDDQPSLYPEIEQLLSERKLEVAEFELSKVAIALEQPNLTGQNRYAIRRLQAKLAIENEQYDEAAEYFMQAHEALPTIIQGRQNRVLALDLLGRRSDAFIEALALVDEGNDSAALLSHLIRTAHNRADLLPVADKIEQHAEASEEICLAMVYANRAWGDHEEALKYAEQAIALAPESAHAWFVRGMVAHHAIMADEWRERFSNAEAALEYYGNAAKFAKRDKYLGLTSEVLSNRARVFALLERTVEAAADYRAAVEASPTRSGYAEDAAAFFLHIGDNDSAWEILCRAGNLSKQGELLMRAVEYHQCPREDKENVIRAMAEIANGGSDSAREACFLAVQWAIDIKDFTLANECVTDAFIVAHPFQGNTLKGWIAGASDDFEASAEYADQALAEPASDAHSQEIFVLARLLRLLEEDEKALPLLERIYTPGVLDDECKALVSCAMNLDRHDVLLRICSELRLTEKIDLQLAKLEVQLQIRYAPETAATLAAESLKMDPPYFKSLFNYLAVLRGKKEEVNISDWELPDTRQLAPEEMNYVLLPLNAVGRHADALQYAYRMLRAHYDSEQAHAQYLWQFLLREKQYPFLQAPSKVQPDSAVCLENTLTSARRWIIIEDDQPDVLKDEYSSTHPTVLALVGREVGDEITVSGKRAIQKQTEKIVEIQSKYVRRFQQILADFSNLFPDSSILQPLHVGSGDDFDPTVLLDFAAAQRLNTTKTLSLYRSTPCSLHLAATRLGIDERRLIELLSESEHDHIQCVDGSLANYKRATETLRKDSRVVLDLSAVITISRLEAWSLLASEIAISVPHSLQTCVNGWLQELERSSDRTSMLIAADGSISVHAQSDEEYQREVAFVTSLLDGISKHCEVTDSSATANVEPQRRALYEQAIGEPSLDAICSAKARNALLWTDDRIVGVAAEAEYSLQRVWTQSAFNSLLRHGLISQDELERVTVQLLDWNYVSTVWHAHDILKAAEVANWDTSARPFTRAINVLRHSSMPIASRARIVGQLLKELQDSTCPLFRQTGIIQSALTALESAAAVMWLKKRLPQFFGLDVLGAEFVRHELEYWLRH